MENTELREISIEKGFFCPSSKAIYDDINPSLSFKDISKQELIALRERFVLYVKMPESFYPYIKRSENLDHKVKKLTEELYQIYDECVFFHNGTWNDNGKVDEYLRRLEQIQCC